MTKARRLQAFLQLPPFPQHGAQDHGEEGYQDVLRFEGVAQGYHHGDQAQAVEDGLLRVLCQTLANEQAQQAACNDGEGVDDGAGYAGNKDRHDEAR